MTKSSHPCATIADGLESIAAFWEVEQPAQAGGSLSTDVDAAHAQGWLGGQRAGLGHVQSWIRHLRRVAKNGFPWCDTCKLPAISTEGFGRLHSTPGSPHGVYPEQDKSGHEATIKEWFSVPGSELGR